MKFALLIFGSLLCAATGALAQVDTIAPVSTIQMATLCADMQDLGECGRKVETEQLKRAGMLASRKGDTLTLLMASGERRTFFDSGGAEGGERFNFFSYHAAADAVVLYHSKADKLDFIIVQRASGMRLTVPNEPIFDTQGHRFVTADVCESACEHKVTVWRMERSGGLRELEFSVDRRWKDGSALWVSGGAIQVLLSNDDQREKFELALDDRRWKVLQL